ncbi:MAG: hypothetical protein ABJA74_14265, partial [Lapillicoccus sp.]
AGARPGWRRRALLESGLPDGLDGLGGAADTARIAERAGLTDIDLARALLELGAAYGLVRPGTSADGGRSRRGPAPGRAGRG